MIISCSTNQLYSKSQTNSDGANTNSLTVAKGRLARNTSCLMKIVLANIKVGDTVTITDPLDGGVGV